MILHLITFSLLSVANAKITTLESKKEVASKKVYISARSNQGNSDFLKKLSAQNEKLLELLKNKSSEEVPFIWDGTKKIETVKIEIPISAK